MYSRKTISPQNLQMFLLVYKMVLYIGKGCFHYLPTNNKLLAGCYQVGSRKATGLTTIVS